MIVGIGIDVVDVADFERRLSSGAVLRAFSEDELAYADRFKTRRAEVLAVRWAAKEAFLKAIGTGLRMEWSLKQIEVVHDDNGRPALNLGLVIKDALPVNARILCSLSHSNTCAVASIIIEQE